MRNEKKLHKLYYNLRAKDGLTLSLNDFKTIINGHHNRSQMEQFFILTFFLTEPTERLNLLYNYLEPKNPELKDYGFESFCNDFKKSFYFENTLRRFC